MQRSENNPENKAKNPGIVMMNPVTGASVRLTRGEVGSITEKEYLLINKLMPIYTILTKSRAHVVITDNKLAELHTDISPNQLEVEIRESVELFKIYIKSVQQSEAERNLTTNANRTITDWTASTTAINNVIVDYVMVLNEHNYIEEAITIAKAMEKLFGMYVGRLNNMKPKYKKANATLIDFIEVKHAQNSFELAYACMQTGDFVSAAIQSAEALNLINIARRGYGSGVESHFDVFHKCILAVYCLQEGDLVRSTMFIDESISFIIKKYEKNGVTLVSPTMIYAIEKLASKYFINKDYARAIHYYTITADLLSKFIDHKKTNSSQCVASIYFAQRNNRFFYLTSELFDNVLAAVKHKLSHAKTFLYNQKISDIESYLKSDETKDILAAAEPFQISKTDKCLTLHLANADNLRIVSKVLSDKRDAFRFQASEPNTIKIMNIDLINLDAIKAVFYHTRQKIRKEQLKNSKMAAESDPRKQVQSPAATPEVGLHTLLANSYSLYKPSANATTKTKSIGDSHSAKEAAPQAQKQTSDNIIRWGNNISYDPAAKTNSVYPLSNPPYIQAGHWYAYLDESSLDSDRDYQVISAAKTILSRGLLSSHGQAVKSAKNELAGTLYSFKIRLLGNEGKGDIRVYGRISTLTGEGNQKLIIFDHIEMHAHKKHHLPLEAPKNNMIP